MRILVFLVATMTVALAYETHNLSIVPYHSSLPKYLVAGCTGRKWTYSCVNQADTVFGLRPLIGFGAYPYVSHFIDKFSQVDAVDGLSHIFVVDDADYATLATALAACSSRECFIYDPTPEHWTSNPFAKYRGTSGAFVQFGPGSWTTTAQIIQPRHVQIGGTVLSGTGQTAIVARSGFPKGKAVWMMGDKADGSGGSTIRNITLDCGNVAGAIGLENRSEEELASADMLQIVNCPGIGLDIETSNAQNSGPFEDITITATIGGCSNCTANTLPVVVRNAVILRPIRGLTINMSNARIYPNVAMRIDGTAMELDDYHCEEATNCLVAGAEGNEAGLKVDTSYFGPNVVTGIVLSKANAVADNSIINEESFPQGVKNLIVDEYNDITVTQACNNTVGIYAVGEGSPQSLTSDLNSACFPGNRTTRPIISNLPTGTAPLFVRSTTPVANLTLRNHPVLYACGTTKVCSAIQQASVHEFYGSVALTPGKPSTARVIGFLPVFTSTDSYICTATNQTRAVDSVKVTNISTNGIMITGPDMVSDIVAYDCKGT